MSGSSRLSKRQVLLLVCCSCICLCVALIIIWHFTKEDEYEKPEPVNCTGTWSAWSTCSQTQCGKYGTKTRTLTKETEARHGGTCETTETSECYAGDCDSPPPPPTITTLPTTTTLATTTTPTTTLATTTLATTTTTQPVARNCVLGTTWKDKSICSKTCGTGTKDQEMEVTSKAAHGGTCIVPTRTVECNTHACPVDCVGDWVQMGNPYREGSCRSHNLKYIKTESYRITAPQQGEGQACPHQPFASRSVTWQPQSFASYCENGDTYWQYHGPPVHMSGWETSASFYSGKL